MSTSDLSAVVKVIEHIERNRVDTNLDSTLQLQHSVLAFYESQGMSVDAGVLEAACQTVGRPTAVLEPFLPRLARNRREKMQAAMMWGVVAASVSVAVIGLVMGALFSSSWAVPVGLGGMLGAVVSFPLAMFCSGAGHHERRQQVYRATLRAASTNDLIVLSHHPDLDDWRQHDVKVELHSRGLSPTGQLLLAATQGVGNV